MIGFIFLYIPAQTLAFIIYHVATRTEKPFNYKDPIEVENNHFNRRMEALWCATGAIISIVILGLVFGTLK